MTQRRAHRTLQRACLLTALAAGHGVTAATPPLPPEDLLEYLGSWTGDDADWLVANATATAAAVQSAVLANAPSAAPVAARQPATTTTTTTAAPHAAPAVPATGAERKP